MLKERLLELLDLLCENMDNSILEHDQKWALTVIEMISVLTEFIDQNHIQISRALPKPME